MFSHSNVRGVFDDPRNVPDDVLLKVKKNGGIVMLLTYPKYLRKDWKQASVKDVVKHINHIRNLIGVDHIGIGGDFNGIPLTAKGWKDVSETPNVFAELMMSKDVNWSEEDLAKIANKNFLRVFKKVERVRDIMEKEKYFPWNNWMKYKDWIVTNTTNETQCRSQDLSLLEKKLAVVHL